MSKAAVAITIVVAVVAVVVFVRVARAQSRPPFRAQDAADERRVSTFVETFMRSDAQARQLLGRSNVSLFAEGYRPRVGLPHDPEATGKKYQNLQAYFARKLYLDLQALQPFGEPAFQRFVDEIGAGGDETIVCAGDMVEKYHMNVQGRFVFENELGKIPAGVDRERFKECWLNDAILGTELRMLAWIYGELFGKPYANPESRGSV